MGRLDELMGILPNTARVIDAGHLTIGGCDTVDLAAEYGTPLYVFDEATLRGQCRLFREEFGTRYENLRVIYAAKALLNRALVQLLMEEGLGLDVVSGGELSIARSVGFPMESVYFHGNNKQMDELGLAISSGVGRIVVDNTYELGLVDKLARTHGVTQDILLRLSPGIDPHTHHHTTTGTVDSKFGLAMGTGEAEEAVKRAVETPSVRLVGLHAHLGSPILSTEPYEQAVAVMLRFAADMVAKHGLDFREFSPGGGFAVQYTVDRPAPQIAEYAAAITEAVASNCRDLGLDRPRLIVEPGRAIVGRAGVALYTVGAVKDIPGVRKYVSVDGGMADNIRPVLYDARYEAIVANRMNADITEKVTIAGKFCESGDILVRDTDLPSVAPGDIIAIPVAGAYCLPMASNYNASLRPAVVFIKGGESRLVRRRDAYEDLIRNDLV
jgi:diaminopimelate decarboxylase